MELLPDSPTLLLRRRAAVAADQVIIFDCFRQTMRAYVDQTWGWDEDYQQAGFVKNIPLENCEVLEAGREFAGFSALRKEAGKWTLRMFCLLPAQQARGHGTAYLRALQIEAARVGVSLRLRMMNVNPARRLYERLGFQAIEDDGATTEMAWTYESIA